MPSLDASSPSVVQGQAYRPSRCDIRTSSQWTRLLLGPCIVFAVFQWCRERNLLASFEAISLVACGGVDRSGGRRGSR
jgi:hypothetical protein